MLYLSYPKRRRHLFSAVKEGLRESYPTVRKKLTLMGEVHRG
jgi:hypothetical protein